MVLYSRLEDTRQAEQINLSCHTQRPLYDERESEIYSQLATNSLNFSITGIAITHLRQWLSIVMVSLRVIFLINQICECHSTLSCVSKGTNIYTQS